MVIKGGESTSGGKHGVGDGGGGGQGGDRPAAVLRIAKGATTAAELHAAH